MAVDPLARGETESLKLLDTFATETVELKEEMQPPTPSHRDSADVDEQELEGEVSEVFLQPSPSVGVAGVRDSGYASLRRQIRMLDRLMQTNQVWLLLSASDKEAANILLPQPPGIFLVRKSVQLQKKVISVRMDNTSQDPIQDFPIKESQYTLSLEGSGISFADLFRLVAFHCVSRDVLPFPLKLPEAIAAARTVAELKEVAQLRAGFWYSELCGGNQSLKPLSRMPAQDRRDQEGQTHRASGETVPPALRTCAPLQLECSRAIGALRFVNPLFVQEHLQAAVKPVLPPRAPPLKPPPLPPKVGKMPEMVYWIAPQAPTPLPPTQWPPSTSEPQAVLEEQTIQGALTRCLERGNSSSTAQEASSGERTGRRPSPSITSLSTSSNDSLDLGRVTGDSSLEEEEEEEKEKKEEEEEVDDSSISVPSKPRKSSSSFAVQRALKGQLRRMSNVLASLRTPERRAMRQIVQLSHNKGSYFGCLVQEYVSFLQENPGFHTTDLDLLQTLRQFLTQTKAYLCQSSELDPPLESFVPEDQIDQVVERALHKCILKPLKEVIEAALHNFQVCSGAWQQVRDNLALAKTKQPRELGVELVVTPDPLAIEKIRHKCHSMCKAYSPEKKVSHLLRICKLIYTIMEENSGMMYGADDFLPMLTYVLVQCDMPQLETEILYMMELLDPSLLSGEGGYYLTSAYGAMSVIKNFKAEQTVQVLTPETRDTLHHWHRRRTIQRDRSVTPSIEDFQNYLRVALQQVDAGCTAKTLLVRPSSTAEEVCQLCADKFLVPDPESHALFLLTGDVCQQLTPDTHPQKIKAEIHSRPQAQPFYFVYRRLSENQYDSHLPSD